MRILQVCSASRLVYGAAHSLMTLASAQKQAGKEVEFLTFKGKEFGAQVRAKGFNVHEVPVRAKLDPLAVMRMRRLIRRNRYDLVHTHLSTSSVNGALAARYAKVPSVATVHGMSGKLSFIFADHLIGVSDRVKDHLVAQGVAAERVSVVYNGLELRKPVEKAVSRRLLDIPADALVMGTVARVTALKGIDDALRAFAALAPHHPDLIYVVVGDGDALESMKSLAGILGIASRVRFEGYRDNVSLYLSAMDIFVFPSHKEAMGIALVEAMAAGIPSVASAIDGIPEVLTNACGILVPPRNPAALSAALSPMIEHPEMRNRMGEQSRARAKEVFSAEAMERSTDWVYRELLGLELAIPKPESQAERQRA